jgi:hypothetical protein
MEKKNNLCTCVACLELLPQIRVPPGRPSTTLFQPTALHDLLGIVASTMSTEVLPELGSLCLNCVLCILQCSCVLDSSFFTLCCQSIPKGGGDRSPFPARTLAWIGIKASATRGRNDLAIVSQPGHGGGEGKLDLPTLLPYYRTKVPVQGNGEELQQILNS